MNHEEAMRQLKETIQKEIVGKITIDPTMDERYGNKVLFQHKIDRLNALLKGTKLDSVESKSTSKE